MSLHCSGMPVTHIVLLKLRADVTNAELAEFKHQAESLDKLEGVLGITSGRNYTMRGLGYNYAVVVQCISKEAEAAYQVHPLHIEVRDHALGKVIDHKAENRACVVDFETELEPGVTGNTSLATDADTEDAQAAVDIEPKRTGSTVESGAKRHKGDADKPKVNETDN